MMHVSSLRIVLDKKESKDLQYNVIKKENKSEQALQIISHVVRNSMQIISHVVAEFYANDRSMHGRRQFVTL
jgi:hypothetical protein